MKKYFYLLFNVMIIFSCSDDKEISNLNDTSTTIGKGADPMIEENKNDGSVPQNKLVYKVMSNSSEYTLEDMDTMYRQDIAITASDYDVNLKNMWYIFINDKLIEGGSEELKRFYLNEQIVLKQNLPNLESFYRLLLSCTSFMNSSELFETSKKFADKNESYIQNDIQWSDEAKKKSKMMNLHYEGAKFQRFMSVSK